MSPVVTVCTASLTFNNCTFYPHSVFMCFVWIWEQIVIIPLHRINWRVLTTEAECVYCAVRKAQWLAPSYAPQFAALQYFICYPQRVYTGQPSTIFNKICALRFRTCGNYLITLYTFRTRLSTEHCATMQTISPYTTHFRLYATAIICFMTQKGKKKIVFESWRLLMAVSYSRNI